MNLLVALTALALSTASASPTIKLAAPGLTYVGIDEKTGGFFVDYLAQQLRTHGIPVTTQSQVAAIIGLERQKSLLGCGESSSECLAELAGALGVDGVITGSLAKTGKGSWVINLNIVAASDGRTIASTSKRVQDDDALLDWINEASRELAPRIIQQLGPRPKPGTAAALPMPPPPAPKPDAPKPDAPKVVASTNTVPNPPPAQVNAVQARPQLAPAPAAPATQFGLLKWVATGVGAAGVLTGGAFYGLAFAQRSSLDSGETEITTRAQLTTKLQEIGSTQNLAVVAGVVGAVGLAAGGALFVLDRPVDVQVTWSPSSAGITLGGTLP